MSNKEKIIITVVEELKGFQYSDFKPHIYDETFWLPLIPLKNKKLEKIGQSEFKFDTKDTIYLDITGTLKVDFEGKGTYKLIDHGDQGSKGCLWELKSEVTEPKATVGIRVRVKDLPNNKMKVGIYVYKLDYDSGLLTGLPFGHDAVLFASKSKIRELLSNIQKKLKK
ncbi:MAG: hypothetical protein GY870_03560 [archaeon]|nr:hypothetical protein [archaeon]